MDKSVAFYTLGCKLNFSESSAIGRQFTDAGYQIAKFTDPADIYLINTCSVTDHADKKCRKVVEEALRHSPNAFIAIVGCYAQLKPAEIAGIPGVDIVLGAAEKFRILEYLGDLTKRSITDIHNKPISETRDFISSFSYGQRTRSFLKVQDGCDYTCSFCTIPLARGASRSETISNVIEQAQQIADSGVKEIVLTGVNLGDFGIRKDIREDRFIDLARQLETINGIDRIRISSIEPNLLTDEIIQFVASSSKFVPHFHIPLQSGSNKILSLMRRRYKRELYAERVRMIKKLMPNCCIGVDVIVGFPGETKADFEETFAFLNELEISYLHVFTYSEREHTLAAEMDNSLPNSIRTDRRKMLQNLSEKKRRAFYETQVGTDAEVLFEADHKLGFMHGFTRNYVKVKTPYDPLMINEIRNVKLESLAADGDMNITEYSEVLMH